MTAWSGWSQKRDIPESGIGCDHHSVYFFMGGELKVNGGDCLVKLFVD